MEYCLNCSQSPQDVGQLILNTTICLPEVFSEMRRTNKTHQIVHHHDNTIAHTSRETSDF